MHLERCHVQVLHRLNIYTTINCPVVQISALDVVFACFIYTNELKGVLNNFPHFGSARLFLFIFAYYIKHLLIYDIW